MTTTIRRSGLPFSLATLLLSSGQVWAEDTPANDNVTATAPGPVESTTTTTAATTAAADESTGSDPTTTLLDATVTPAPRYPRAVYARPLTLPRGLAMAGADVVANHNFDTLAGSPIAGYGITDALEVQVAYAFTAMELAAEGSLNVDVGHMVLRGALGGKLEAIARVRGGYNLLDDAVNPLLIGVHVQYSLTDSIALISGVPGTQQLRLSLEEDASMARPIDLSLPVGIGFQMTDLFYLQLDTRLVQVDLHESATTVVGADTTPVSITAVYNALPALDLQAALGTDLSNDPGDSLTFLVGARYYAGEL